MDRIGASGADDAVADVTWMIRGAWVTLCLRAATELEIVDHIGDSATADEIAARTSTDASTLARFLRVLADLGLLSTNDGTRYSVTARGETLRSDHPSALRSLALMQTVLPNLAAWQSLADALRSGSDVFTSVNDVEPWQFLSENPAEEAIFNASMARRGGLQATAIRQACDLSGVATVVDVGGGRGGMLIELLKAEPALRAIVADRPEVAVEASEAFATAGMGDRASGVSADFFASVPPGGDAYVLSNVLHDWNDQKCVAILLTVRAAMAPGARLWIVEMVLDAPDRSAMGMRDLHLVDLHMLVMFGARERTKAEYDALLVAAGFGTGTLLDTGVAWNVIETRA